MAAQQVAAASGKKIVAQFDAPPAQPQQGPLGVGQYESVAQLRDELVAMGPAPETYEKIMTLVGPDREDDAKEALSSFFQGLAAALFTLYNMLVDVGIASPIDAETVEKLMSQHPNLHDKKDEPGTIQAGLFLPPLTSGLNTKTDKLEKIAGGSVGGAGAGYPAYAGYGSGENRMCPKIRQPVSTFICRYHCLDGLNVDDHQTLCGEAIWRQAVMDKFSVEHRDADGKWVGGYLEKRFEIHHDDGGHPALIKPGERANPIHEDAWSIEKRLAEMRKTESKDRGYSETPGDGPKDLYNFDQHDIKKGPKNPQLCEKKKDKIAQIDSMFVKTAGSGDGFDKVPWAKPQPNEGKEEPSDEDLKDAKSTPPKKKTKWPPPDNEIPWAKEDKKSFNLKRRKQAVFTPSVDDVNSREPGIKNVEMDWEYHGRDAEGEKVYFPYIDVTYISRDNPSFQDTSFSGTTQAEAVGQYNSWAEGQGFVPLPVKERDYESQSYDDWELTGLHREREKQEVQEDRELDQTYKALEKPRAGTMASSSNLTKTAWGLHAPTSPLKPDYGGDKSLGMGEGNVGKVGTKCSLCGKTFGPGVKMCDVKMMANGNPHPPTPTQTLNQNQATGDSGAIDNAGLIKATADAEIVVANDIYRASKNGVTAFGDTEEQALEKLARGLADTGSRSVADEAAGLMNFRRSDEGMKEIPQATQNPIQEEVPVGNEFQPPVVSPEMGGLPKIQMEDGVSVGKTSPVPMESQGPSEFYPPEVVPPSGWQVPEDDGQAHVSANDLDKELETAAAGMHPDEHKAIVEQAISSGAHPRQGE